MATVSVPRTLEAATQLLERFAELDGQIAEIEAGRRDSIAAVNARCDTAANDLIGRRDDIRTVLEPWWNRNAAKLTQGQRKSIELGGCMIGSRTGRPSLAVAGDEKLLARTLAKRKWAIGLIRITLSLDKTAIMKALDGAYRKHLTKLGFNRKPGEEAFFVERVEQDGTLGGS